MKKVKIDVMILGGAKFYCTLLYQFSALTKFNIADAERFVFEKRPTLRYRNDVVLMLEEA